MCIRRLVRHERIAAIAAILGILTLLMPLICLQAAQEEEKGTKQAADGKGLLLSDRHKAAGIVCSGCHTQSPTQIPSTKVCTECHGPYEKLAAKTEKVEPNPHASHLGELDCGDCHHAHKPSVDYCARCHTYGLRVP